MVETWLSSAWIPAGVKTHAVNLIDEELLSHTVGCSMRTEWDKESEGNSSTAVH